MVFRFVQYERTNYITINFDRFAVIRLPLHVVTRHSWQGRPLQNDIHDVEFVKELSRLRSRPREHVSCRTQLERLTSKGFCDGRDRSLKKEVTASPALILASLPELFPKRIPLLRNNGHRQQPHNLPMAWATNRLIMPNGEQFLARIFLPAPFCSLLFSGTRAIGTRGELPKFRAEVMHGEVLLPMPAASPPRHYGNIGPSPAFWQVKAAQCQFRTSQRPLRAMSARHNNTMATQHAFWQGGPFGCQVSENDPMQQW